MQRKWTIGTEVDDFGNATIDWGQVEASLSEAVAILHRLGGAVTVAALRDELEDGSFEPQGFLFVWDSFVPAQRRPRAVDEPEPAEAA